jgi:hypothetical protein
MWASLKEKYYADISRKECVVEERPLPEGMLENLRAAAAAAPYDQETKEIFSSFVKRKLLKEAPDLTSTITADICEDCGVQMMVIANDSMLACRRCAKTRVITSANAWNASMDLDFSAPNNHQKSRVIEWLEYAQAKEYGEIPEEMLHSTMEILVSQKLTGLEPFTLIIANEYAKCPFVDSADAIKRLSDKIPDIENLLKNIDGVMIRNAIRSGPAKKYFERSPKIASILSGYWPERLSANQEEYVRKLFIAATPIYDKWRKTSQPVWPGGYTYFIRCLMILLGWDEFAALFPIQLTGRNQEREDMRLSIWNTLKWEFVPSTGTQSVVMLPNGLKLDGEMITRADKNCKVSARGYDEL